MIDDDVFENSEAFRVEIIKISVPYGVELGTAVSIVVTILDNDRKYS